MTELYPWLGDLHNLGLGREVTGLIVILASVVCGALVGMERESQDKPAGMRTVILICVGATIFTLAGILLSGTKSMADPARIASQIVPGIGFLGAGAIIQLRGSVQGLTTAATIWAVAAVGVVVGTGYVAAGLCFTGIILVTLSLFRRLEALISGPCVNDSVTIRYRTNNGKARPRLQSIFDLYQFEDEDVRESEADEEGQSAVTLNCCRVHRHHRSLLKELAEIPEVVSLSIARDTEKQRPELTK